MNFFKVLLLGGAIALIGQFNWWEVGIYSIIIGIVIFILEYPRSGKPSLKLLQDEDKKPIIHNEGKNKGKQKTSITTDNGRSLPRHWQNIPGNVFKKLGFIYVNFFPRSFLYLM